jgi:pimeloyl-ACP methyl ester carboxylesterase
MDVEIRKEGKYQYLETGEGPTLIILHGLFGALSNFKELAAHFSSNYRVVIPILPLYTLPILNTHVRSLAAHVEDFIDYKGFRDFNLLGNSLGGHIGLVYTSRRPEMLHSLILTGSSGLYENAFGGSFPRRESYDFIKKKVEYTFYDPKIATKEIVDECFEVVNDKARALRIITIAKSAIRHNMAKELPKMDLPVLLIWGKNDNITPPEVAHEFQSLLPHADLFWIDKCGHAPMMEHPETFNNILETWLNKLYGKS